VSRRIAFPCGSVEADASIAIIGVDETLTSDTAG
jgi:hypothetical protein